MGINMYIYKTKEYWLLISENVKYSTWCGTQRHGNTWNSYVYFKNSVVMDSAD